MSTVADQDNGWKEIIERLAGVGKTEVDQIDYFSSIVPRHLAAYGSMMGKGYDASTTREQAREDWNQTTVVDVIDRITSLEDETYRRAVRILVHFLDFSLIRSPDRTEFHEARRVRFEIYDLMNELRQLRSSDGTAYAQALDGLRTLEGAANAA